MEESNLHGEVKMARCIMHHDVYMRKSIFVKVLSLRESVFKMRLDFSYAKFNETVVLYGSNPTTLVLDRYQIDGRIFSETEGDFQKAKEVYMLLRRTFEMLGNHEGTDWAYYRFRRAERKCHKKSLTRFCNWIFFDIGCGYGTKPFNVTTLAISVVLLFAFPYWIFSDQFIISPEIRDAGMTDVTFYQAIYISAMNFTTLGTEGISPNFDHWLKYFVVVEGFLGLFLTTVFVGTYTRKMVK